MKKEFLSTSELSELEALEIRGGANAGGDGIMAQSTCTNNAEECGGDLEQGECSNTADMCGGAANQGSCINKATGCGKPGPPKPGKPNSHC